MFKCNLQGSIVVFRGSTLDYGNLEAVWHVSSDGLPVPVLYFACLKEATDELVGTFFVWIRFSGVHYGVTAVHHFFYNSQCLDGCLIYVIQYRVVIWKTVNTVGQSWLDSKNYIRRQQSWEVIGHLFEKLFFLSDLSEIFLSNNMYTVVF